MAAPHPDDLTDLAALEKAYRKALFTILGHGLFFLACCVVAVPFFTVATTLTQGAGMSDSEKPPNTVTAGSSGVCICVARSQASFMGPPSVVLRSVWLISARGFQMTSYCASPRHISSSSRPACSPVSYMSMCG